MEQDGQSHKRENCIHIIHSNVEKMDSEKLLRMSLITYYGNHHNSHDNGMSVGGTK